MAASVNEYGERVDEEKPERPFEEVYDWAVRECGETKAEMRAAKDALKEATDAHNDAIKRLQELRKYRTHPQPMRLPGM